MHINHIAIWAADIEKLKSFYETYFDARANAPYLNAAKRFTSYFLGFASGARLELMHRPDIPGTANDALRQATGIVHIAFSVGSEAAVDALTERLRADGHPVLDGPRRTGDGYYESVVLDPEDNRLEITV